MCKPRYSCGFCMCTYTHTHTHAHTHTCIRYMTVVCSRGSFLSPREPSLFYSLRQELNDTPIELQERLVKWRQEEFSESLVRDSYGFLQQGGSPELALDWT